MQGKYILLFQELGPTNPGVYDGPQGVGLYCLQQCAPQLTIFLNWAQLLLDARQHILATSPPGPAAGHIRHEGLVQAHGAAALHSAHTVTPQFVGCSDAHKYGMPYTLIQILRHYM